MFLFLAGAGGWVLLFFLATGAYFAGRAIVRRWPRSRTWLPTALLLLGAPLAFIDCNTMLAVGNPTFGATPIGLSFPAWMLTTVPLPFWWLFSYLTIAIMAAIAGVMATNLSGGDHTTQT